MSRTVHRYVPETFDFSGKIYYNENVDADIWYLIFEKQAAARDPDSKTQKGMEEPGVTVDYGGIYE